MACLSVHLPILSTWGAVGKNVTLVLPLVHSLCTEKLTGACKDSCQPGTEEL